jgi:hypothetical protein
MSRQPGGLEPELKAHLPIFKFRQLLTWSNLMVLSRQRVSGVIAILLLTFLGAYAQIRPDVTTTPNKPAAPKPAQLVIETSPSAEVYLDDQFVGRASQKGRLVIANPKAGEHDLRVSMAGKKDFERKVTMIAGQMTTITAALADLGGNVIVLTSPGAEVFLDNSTRGAADASGQLSIPSVAAGSHELRVTAVGKKEYRQNIVVPAGQEAKIEARLEDLGPAPAPPPYSQPVLHGSAKKEAPPDTLPVAIAPPLKDPDSQGIQHIVQEFAAKEKVFREARNNYTYYQINKVEEFAGNGSTEIVGTFEQDWDILYDDSGKRIEKVTSAPLNTLKGLIVTNEDIE